MLFPQGRSSAADCRGRLVALMRVGLRGEQDRAGLDRIGVNPFGQGLNADPGVNDDGHDGWF